MNNSIWRKNVYSGAINSYTKIPSNIKIKGTLLELNGNKIKVNIGKEKTLNITLNKPMNAKVGDNIVIDRRNIVQSKLDKQTDETMENKHNMQNKYDYILKSLNISVNDTSIDAVKSLENYKVNITKENILSFISAKDQLSNISEKLDYDTAVKLVKKDINFEKESLQKVLQEMQKAQGEKPSFSLLRFLGIKKDMTTEEAEKIAYNIYGNKTGKDITDIIKALDKAGLDTSKENIETINNVFSKLHNIKDIEDKTIIDSVKNKIETSIDNLYKLKNAIEKGTIKAEEKIGELASKVYEAYSGAVSTITEKELEQMEDDIVNRLKHMGIKVTEEVIRLSKDVIAKGLDLTKENLYKIMSVRGAITELNSDLNYEKTALLMASGIEVEKIDVSELANIVNIEDVSAEENITLGLDRLEILELIENIDIKTLALHIKLGVPTTLESLSLSQQLVDGNITVNEWISSLINLELQIEETLQKELLTGETKLLQILDKLVDSETKDLDIVTQNYLRANKGKLGTLIEEDYKNELVKSIIQSEIPLNNNNIQQIYMLKRSLDGISENLTYNTFQSLTEESMPLQKLSIGELSNTITSLNKDEINQNAEVINMMDNIERMEEVADKIKNMTNMLEQISPERKNTIISLLMKNAMPLTLKEVQSLSFFLNNQRQIGQQLDEILNIINKNENEDIIKIAEELKKAINKIDAYIKEGKQIDENPYREFSKLLKELENKSSFLTKGEAEALQKGGEKLLDSLELQLQLNREDTVLQLPLMMGEQLKNLQIYIMKDKKGSKKIDPSNMSVLLNFDTNNMGNVNIYVAVNYKNIVMKMGLANKEDQKLIEKYSTELEEHLKDLGYDLKDLSFRIDDDNHIFSMVDEVEGKNPKIKRLLDVKI